MALPRLAKKPTAREIAENRSIANPFIRELPPSNTSFNQQPPTQPTPTQVKQPPAVFRNEKGKVSGVDLGDGRTFLGLSPKDVDKILAGEARKNKTPEGALEMSQRAELTKQLILKKQLAQNLGVISSTDLGGTPAEKTNFGGAVAAGLGEAAITGAAGAGTGAAAGLIGGPAAPVTVPVAAGAVGAIAAVGGFIHGFTRKLKADANQNIQAEFTNLGTNSRNLRYLIADVNKGGDPVTSKIAFDSQLRSIDQARRNLKELTSKNLNKFLSVDTQVEMARFEEFYSEGGLREILVARMQQALINPNPNADIISEEEMAGLTDLQQ